VLPLGIGFRISCSRVRVMLGVMVGDRVRVRRANLDYSPYLLTYLLTK